MTRADSIQRHIARIRRSRGLPIDKRTVRSKILTANRPAPPSSSQSVPRLQYLGTCDRRNQYNLRMDHVRSTSSLTDSRNVATDMQGNLKQIPMSDIVETNEQQQNRRCDDSSVDLATARTEASFQTATRGQVLAREHSKNCPRSDTVLAAVDKGGKSQRNKLVAISHRSISKQRRKLRRQVIVTPCHERVVWTTSDPKTLLRRMVRRSCNPLLDDVPSGVRTEDVSNKE